MTPPQNVTGATVGRDKGAVAESPEPEEPKKDTNKEINPLLALFQRVAPNVFAPTDYQQRVVMADLAEATITREDHTIRISGVGDCAAIYQDRYARHFERALVGVLNEVVTVKFEA